MSSSQPSNLPLEMDERCRRYIRAGVRNLPAAQVEIIDRFDYMRMGQTRRPLSALRQLKQLPPDELAVVGDALSSIMDLWREFDKANGIKRIE